MTTGYLISLHEIPPAILLKDRMPRKIDVNQNPLKHQ
jgi:hypothetical protein